MKNALTIPFSLRTVKAFFLFIRSWSLQQNYDFTIVRKIQ
jgi:hypothetical protein